MIVCPVFSCCSKQGFKIATIVKHSQSYSAVLHAACDLPVLSTYRTSIRGTGASFSRNVFFSKANTDNRLFVLHCATAPDIMVGDHALTETLPSVQQCVTSPELQRSCPKRIDKVKESIRCVICT